MFLYTCVCVRSCMFRMLCQSTSKSDKIHVVYSTLPEKSLNNATEDMDLLVVSCRDAYIVLRMPQLNSAHTHKICGGENEIRCVFSFSQKYHSPPCRFGRNKKKKATGERDERTHLDKHTAFVVVQIIGD